MGDPMQRFLDRTDESLQEGRLGLLCNHAAFCLATGRYLWDALAERGRLCRLFVPEHGLFAELQDQVPLAATETYEGLGLGAEIVSLYGNTEDTLAIAPDQLADLDALVVDIQDVGSRYYTFATTLSYVFDALAASGRELAIFVIDRPNPAGRQVEGTPLSPEYASFVGRPGLPHRHGLTVGELARFYLAQTGAAVQLEVERLRGDETWSGVAPSPNIPSLSTALVYSGQCLLEGTNLSEGRGTTRPFELFGAPFLDWIWQGATPPPARGAVLRRTRFVPVHQKHAGVECHGFQIHLTGGPYHSLAHTLQLLRWIRQRSGDAFQWRRETYEYRSDRPAIELLAGDDLLLAYLRGSASFDEVQVRLGAAEQEWVSQARQYLIYEEPLALTASRGDSVRP